MECKLSSARQRKSGLKEERLLRRATYHEIPQTGAEHAGPQTLQHFFPAMQAPQFNCLETSSPGSRGKIEVSTTLSSLVVGAVLAREHRKVAMISAVFMVESDCCVQEGRSGMSICSFRSIKWRCIYTSPAHANVNL